MQSVKDFAPEGVSFELPETLERLSDPCISYIAIAIASLQNVLKRLDNLDETLPLSGHGQHVKIFTPRRMSVLSGHNG